MRALCLQIGIPFVEDLKANDIDPKLVDDIPINYAKAKEVLPIAQRADAEGRPRSLIVAVSDPFNETVDRRSAGADSASRSGSSVSTRMRIQDAINRVYERNTANLVEKIEGEFDEDLRPRRPDRHPRGDRGRRARHQVRQLADLPRGQGEGFRHSHRAVRKGIRRALPRRRRALRHHPPAQARARRDLLAHQGHGHARHRRKAPAAGRPHQDQDRRQGHRYPSFDRADASTASAWSCVFSSRPAPCSQLEQLGFNPKSLRRDRKTDLPASTASSSSPAPRAAVNRRRFRRAWSSSTAPSATS